jgi:hypothetical protein
VHRETPLQVAVAVYDPSVPKAGVNTISQYTLEVGIVQELPLGIIPPEKYTVTVALGLAVNTKTQSAPLCIPASDPVQLKPADAAKTGGTDVDRTKLAGARRRRTRIKREPNCLVCEDTLGKGAGRRLA